MPERAQLIGGPMDGKESQVPAKPLPPKEAHAMAFGDHIYVYAELNGRKAWHYCGTVTWTPEEQERRKAMIQ